MSTIYCRLQDLGKVSSAYSKVYGHLCDCYMDITVIYNGIYMISVA